MLPYRVCGTHISSLGAEAARRIAGEVEGGAVVTLTRELWAESSPDQRCPHVRFEGRKCRCAAVEAADSELVCDTASLQLWCLDGERYPKCIFYPAEAKQLAQTQPHVEIEPTA